MLIGYINHRYIKMQSTIAIMVASMLLSAVLLVLKHFGIEEITQQIQSLIAQTDFRNLLLRGMLSFLLFAGALTIDFNALKNQRWEIGTLASISTIASTLIIGTLTFQLLPLIDLHLPLMYCLLFGALISPTDPIAVLATFKQIKAPKSLEMCVAGESLFNDGVAIVLFITLYQLTFDHATITASNVILLFSRQALGGITYGLLLGYIAYQLIRKIDDQKIIILISLAIVTGGYSFALWLDISGPLAMVVSGILIGNQIRKSATDNTHETLNTFWEVIDEVLNAVLFLLIGFELLAIKASPAELIAVFSAIPIILLTRLLTVAIPMKFLQRRRNHGPYTISILTWGGLRGGLAVALALSLPNNEHRSLILAITYGVVAFSVIVQGLSIKHLVQLAKNS